MFSVAQIIFAPLNSIIKNALGSKTVIVVGFSLLTVTTLGLGAVAYITNPHVFKYAAVALRFFQGQGDIMVQVTCYNILCTVYSDNVMEIIRYIEMCVGVGLGAGPFLGSAVYGSIGYANTMYLFAALNAATLALCLWALPAALNRREKPAALTASQKASAREIRWKEILTNKHSNFALLTCFLGTFVIVFYAGFLGDQLIALKFNENLVGFVFGSQCVVYLAACLAYPYVFEHWPRKIQFVFAFIGYAACDILMGPSKLLDLPDNYWIIIAGTCLTGFF